MERFESTAVARSAEVSLPRTDLSGWKNFEGYRVRSRVSRVAKSVAARVFRFASTLLESPSISRSRWSNVYEIRFREFAIAIIARSNSGI